MKREIKIGIFAVVTIGALWGGVRFLKGYDILSRNTVYYATYDQVDGIQNAAPILIQGVKVGSVTDIRLDPQRDCNVVVQLTVQRKYKIPKDSEARIYSASLMGGKSVRIELGASPEYLEGGDTLTSSRDRDLMDMAGSEIEFFKQKLSQITADLSRTMGNLNAIMETNAAHIEGTMSHLNSITGEVDGLLVSQRANLQSAVKDLADFAGMLGENSPRIEQIVTNLDDFSGQLAKADLVASLDATLRDVRAIMAGIEAGEGTLGKLAQDDRLYESLYETSENLSSLLVDVEAYPGRYISVFGGARKKAEKQRAKDSVAAAGSTDNR